MILRVVLISSRRFADYTSGLRLAIRPIYSLTRNFHQGQRIAAPFFAQGSTTYRSTMVKKGKQNLRVPKASAIAAARAIFTPLILSFYDGLVHVSTYRGSLIYRF